MYMYIFVITQMLNFGSFDMKGKSSVLPCIQELMTLVYKPAMKVNENIGDLAKTPQGKQTYSRFLDTVDQFVQYLNSKYIFVHVAKFGPIDTIFCLTIGLDKPLEEDCT